MTARPGADEWRRVGACDVCNRVGQLVVFEPSDCAVPAGGRWVCSECNPGEHDDFARGLAVLGEELGHKSN